MRRRTFVSTLIAVASVRPLAAAPQSAMLVVGLLDSGSAAEFGPAAAAFREGLREAGFIEGLNIAIETRWAEGRYDQLPLLATELVRLPVAVLAATGITAALASQRATAMVPVVFHTGGDPVQAGLVASLSRPGRNVTGVVSLGKILLPKQLELLHELVPNAHSIGFLANPKNGVLKSDTDSVREAALAKTVEAQLVLAGNDGEIDAAVAQLGERQIGALLVQPDPFLDGRLDRIAALATRHSVPAMAAYPQFARSGGLISYGNSPTAAYRLEAAYIARILKGEKPADMPVQQSVKVEMIINLKTAKALGLTVPQALLARADEVIE
ncbi:MAG TPA: ABC transporter substrate-binding protein [Stellaceae bacterium]